MAADFSLCSEAGNFMNKQVSPKAYSVAENQVKFSQILNSSLQIVLRYPKIQNNFRNSNNHQPPRLSRVLLGEGTLNKTLGVITNPDKIKKTWLRMIENTTDDNKVNWKASFTYCATPSLNKTLISPVNFSIECIVNPEILNEMEKSINSNGIKELQLLIEISALWQDKYENLFIGPVECHGENRACIVDGILRDIFW